MWTCYVENFGCLKPHHPCTALRILTSPSHTLHLLRLINLSYIPLKNDILERLLTVVVCHKVDVHEFWTKCTYIVLFY